MSGLDVVARIRDERVIALLRRVADPDAIVDELVAAGLGVVEVTLDSDGALATIARLRAREDVSVIAGTVRTEDEARAAVEMGAEGIVSPVFHPGILGLCAGLGVPAIAGAFTPTEIEAAWRGGAALVKLFPARLGGPTYVADVLKPLRDVPVVCTGGVTSENAGAYLDAGAVAVAVSFREDVASAAERVAAVVRRPR